MDDFKYPFQVLGASASERKASMASDVSMSDERAGFLHRLRGLACSAMRSKLSESGYDKSDLNADAMAGVVVSLVALPLGMALAISTGVPPQHGLYTVIISGFLVAVLGGSRFQVTGPTAAFVPVLGPIVSRFGLQGLLLAGLMSGVLELLYGLLGFGALIHYMPDTVKYGFTGGIAVVIASQQLKDFFGLTTAAASDHFLGKMEILFSARHTTQLHEFLLAFFTLVSIFVWSSFNTKIPAAIVVLSATTLFAFFAAAEGLQFATIASRFAFALKDGSGSLGHGIPPYLPQFSVPWSADTLSLHQLGQLLPFAFQISLLGAIESLLSAIIADGMAGGNAERHNSDGELVALGIANIVCPFFGGIASTGALARTAVNIRSGARSPVSCMIHAGIVLLALVVLAPVLGHVPMASLAGLLLFVAYRMGEFGHLLALLFHSPKNDKIVLVSCFLLTVLVDMVYGVFGGIVIAAVLFAQDVTSSTQAVKRRVVASSMSLHTGRTVAVFELNGPLFFGSAASTLKVLEVDRLPENCEGVVLEMENVSMCDISGATALAAALEKLLKQNLFVYVVGIRHHPLLLLRGLMIGNKAAFAHLDNLRIIDSLSTLQRAMELVADFPCTPQIQAAAEPRTALLPSMEPLLLG